MAKKPAKKMAKPAKKMMKKAAPAKKAAAAKPEIQKIRSSIRPRNTSTNSYTFSEFLENVRGFAGLNKRTEAKLLVEDLANFFRDALKRGYKIPLLGLGKIYVRETKPRLGRNPATGETIHIPAKKKVRFAPAKALKEHVLK